MVKLDGFDNPEFIGVISRVEIKPLRDHIKEEYHESFSNLERDHVVLHYTVDDQEKDWFAMLPSLQGYSNSNLKKLRTINPELPDDTDEWVGCDIRLKLDAKGYLAVSL